MLLGRLHRREAVEPAPYKRERRLLMGRMLVGLVVLRTIVLRVGLPGRILKFLVRQISLLGGFGRSAQEGATIVSTAFFDAMARKSSI